MGAKLNGKHIPTEVVAMVLEYLMELPINEALKVCDVVNRHLSELIKVNIVNRYQERVSSRAFFLPPKTLRFLEQKQKQAFIEELNANDERYQHRVFSHM